MNDDIKRLIIKAQVALDKAHSAAADDPQLRANLRDHWTALHELHRGGKRSLFLRVVK